MLYDVFISHASEDKDEFVHPLAELLREQHLEVWYDEFSLNVGDSLRRSIDRGLSQSRYGIVVLSPSFFRKQWSQWELDGLVARQNSGDAQFSSRSGTTSVGMRCSPTRPLEVVRRLRSWFEPGEFHTVVAERAVAVAAACGPLPTGKLAREAFALLGGGWRRGENAITAHDIERTLRAMSHQLQALDLVEVNRSLWSPGASARSLLPGATLLADLV